MSVRARRWIGIGIQGVVKGWNVNHGREDPQGRVSMLLGDGVPTGERGVLRAEMFRRGFRAEKRAGRYERDWNRAYLA